MISFVVNLTDGPEGLDVEWHPPVEGCRARSGLFLPAGGERRRVFVEPFGAAYVLHVPSVAVLKELVKRGGVEWAGGRELAAQKAAAAAWEWPTVDLVDAEGKPAGKADLEPPVISGGHAPDQVEKLAGGQRLLGWERQADKLVDVKAAAMEV